MAIDRRHFSGLLLGGGAAAAAAAFTASPAAASPQPEAGSLHWPGSVHNIVLVHGAYADGSSWSRVIPLLQAAGLTVTSVQNPLTSLADDVAATRRALDQQSGPTILVAHSYGGSVITEAGDHPAVKSLVYFSARAPEPGEDYTALGKKFPTPPANAGLVYSEGFGGLTEDAFVKDFANGLPETQARTLYAAQGRIAKTLFADRTTVAAWRDKPSRYVITTDDRTAAPELQRYVARRMNARTTTVATGHLSILIRPDVAARVILEAAR